MLSQEEHPAAAGTTFLCGLMSGIVWADFIFCTLIQMLIRRGGLWVGRIPTIFSQLFVVSDVLWERFSPQLKNQSLHVYTTCVQLVAKNENASLCALRPCFLLTSAHSLKICPLSYFFLCLAVTVCQDFAYFQLSAEHTIH